MTPPLDQSHIKQNYKANKKCELAFTALFLLWFLLDLSHLYRLITWSERFVRWPGPHSFIDDTLEIIGVHIILTEEQCF